MTATRRQLAERLIRDVFDVGIGSNLEKALVENGIMDPLSWLACDDTVFQNMEFTDAGGVTKKLRFGDYHPIRILRAMVFYKRTHGEPLTYDGTEILQQEFDDFMGSNECISIMVPSLPLTGIMSTAHKEFTAFQKGMKRDSGLYPVITQDAHEWDSWNCSLVSIAHAQATEQVLDSTYVPALPDEIALFAEKQKYMYSVFERTLRSDKGKAIVRSHEATYDAQKVYKELYDYCCKSTRAVFGSSTMQSYTSSVRVGDGSWSASAQSDRQFGTASFAKLAQTQTRQVYARQFDRVADEYGFGSPVSVIQANPGMRRSGKGVVEACQYLTFDPGDNTTAVAIDDFGQDVSADDHRTVDHPALHLLACPTNDMDSDGFPHVHLLCTMTSDAINCHAKDKQGFARTNAPLSNPIYSTVTYSASSSTNISTSSGGAIANGGSNRQFAGSKTRVHHKHANGRTMDIEAIVRQRMCRTPFGTAGAVGKTVHSVGQIEAFQHGAYDESTRVGGQQSIHMITSEADWYPNTLNKDEWDNLHHFSPTLAADRDLNMLGRELDDDGAWFNALMDETDSVHVTGSENLKMHYKSPFHALTVFRSDATVEKTDGPCGCSIIVQPPARLHRQGILVHASISSDRRGVSTTICPVQGDFTM
jgi:hypothetical protein